MKYFFDTEFIEDGRTIDLISIGIVCEDGRKYYAINKECDFSKANQWVKENVLIHLPKRFVNPQTASPSEMTGMRTWKSRDEIRKEIAHFFGCIEEVVRDNPQGWSKLLLKVRAICPAWVTQFLQSVGVLGFHSKTRVRYEITGEKPEIWAYYADYDWVAFCQLFGTMMDLPKGFPMYCRDLKQECDRLGNPRLPHQKGKEHDALADAEWVAEGHEWLESWLESLRMKLQMED